MADKIIKANELVRAVRVKNSKVGRQFDALNQTLQARLSILDEDELKVLDSIKDKLNEGLNDAAREAADTVGGFVW